MDRLRRDERGTLSAEFVAFIPIVTVLLAIGWQLLVVVAAGNSTAHAARNASRSLATSADIETTIEESLPSWLRDEMEYEVSGTKVTVEVEVPLLFPATGVRPFTLERTAELPRN